MNYENTSRIPDIKEAYKNIQTSLGNEVFKQYSLLLGLYFSSKISKLKFDEDSRKLLTTPEHLHLHNLFLLSLSSKTLNSEDSYETQVKNLKYSTQELCLLNEDFLKDRIIVNAIDNGLEDVDDSVGEMITLAVQIFIKNIISASVSRTSGFKLRENTFQHSIGLPAPNPWLINTSNIMDATQDRNTTLNDEEKTFEPVLKENLDIIEQQTAFNFACGATTNQNTRKLTLKSLYETLLDDPTIINNHAISSINLERMIAQLNCP